MAQQFQEGSVGARYLAELEGSEVLAAFEAAGEETFQRYYQDHIPFEGENQDKFFRSILGDELADKIIAANDIEYGAKIPLNNHYITWARSQFDVQPKF